MTRDEQIVFCRKCLNRKMDPKQGYICNLTGEKATFESECANYIVDESIKDRVPDNVEALQPHEIQGQLSKDTLDKLRKDQKLIPAISAGFIVGIIGAFIWGYITVLTQYQIGYLALAIGAGVGFTIRKFGNGIDNIFGFWGAGISLFSVLFGNFLSVIGFIANTEGLGLMQTLFLFDYSYLPEVMAETFSPMDLVFYGIAIYEGYKLSFRVVTQKDLLEMNSGM